MTNRQLLDRVTEIMDCSDEEAKEWLLCFVSVLEEGILKDGHCVINGFGAFDLRERKAGIVYNFAHSKVMPINPRRVIHFKPGRTFLRKIRGLNWEVNNLKAEEIRQAKIDEYNKNRIKYIHFGISLEEFLGESGEDGGK